MICGFTIRMFSITCRPAGPTSRIQAEPNVVFEVLPESTARTDTGEKRMAYLTIPTLEAYVLIDPDRREVTVWRQRDDQWVPEVLSAPDAVLDFTSAVARSASERSTKAPDCRARGRATIGGLTAPRDASRQAGEKLGQREAQTGNRVAGHFFCSCIRPHLTIPAAFRMIVHLNQALLRKNDQYSSTPASA